MKLVQSSSIYKTILIISFQIVSSNVIPADDSTTLEQLDDYSLLGIIECLPYNDTLKLLTTSKRFQNVITQKLLEKKFSERMFRFEVGGSKWKFYDDPIILDSYESIMEALENSGHLIKRLIFDSNQLDSEQILNISHAIEQHLSGSLVEISLKDMFGENLLSIANRAFLKVTSVSLTGNIHLGRLRLYEIFPNIKEFTVSSISTLPNETLHHKYDQLTRVTSYDKSDKNSKLLPFLQWNPQIRVLNLSPLPSLEVLQSLNKSLSNLEILYLSCSLGGCYENSGNHQIVYLESVRNLEIRMNGHIIETYPLSTGQLEELSIIAYRLGDFSIRLIKENKNLRILHIPEMFRPNDFLRVVNALNDLTKLKEVTLTWNKELNQAEFQHLINDFEQLNIAKFIVENPDQRDELFSNISNKWRLTNEEIIHHRIHLTFLRNAN